MSNRAKNPLRRLIRNPVRVQLQSGPTLRMQIESLESRRLLTSVGFATERVFTAGIDMESALVDVDQDGRNDIVQSFGEQGDIRWLRNLGDDQAGDERFARGETLLFVPGGFSALAISDLNGDDQADFVVARNSTTQIHIYEASSDNPLHFEEHVIADHPTFQPTQLIVGDAQTDGRRQLFAVREAGLNLFESSAGSVFSLTDTLATNNNSAVLGDVNGDGNAILFFGRPRGRIDDLWMVSTDGGSFGDQTMITEEVYGFHLADIDGDGRDELLLRSRDHRFAKFAYGDNGFELAAEQLEYPAVLAMEVADLDADGQSEIALVTGVELVLLNGQSLEVESRFDFPIPARRPFGGDVVRMDLKAINNDDFPDLLLWANSTLSWYANEGGEYPAIETFRQGAAVLDADDFDGDGILDPLFRRGEELGVWLSSDEFSPVMVYELESQAKFLYELVDMDGDNAPDLVLAIDKVVHVARFDRSQNQFLPLTEMFRTFNRIQTLFVGEMSSDGIPDLLVTTVGGNLNHEIHVVEQDANGTFERTQLVLGIGNIASTVVVADVDGDGDSDFVSLDRSKLTTLLNRDGMLGDSFENDLLADSIVALDVNGDGRDELLVKERFGLNQLLSFDSATSHYSATPVDVRITDVTSTADMNGDGRDDLAGAGRSGFYRYYGVEDGLDLEFGSFVRTRHSGLSNVFFDLDADGADETLFNLDDAVVFADPRTVEAGNFAVRHPVWNSSTFANFSVFGDFDGDGTDDWAVINGSGVYVSFAGEDHQWLNHLDMSEMPANVGWSRVLDLDGDGRDEILLPMESQTILLRLPNGPIETIPLDLDRTAEPHDYDADGLTDFVWLEVDSNSIQWRKNNGNGEFSAPQTILSLPISFRGFRFVDMDGGAEEIIAFGDGLVIYKRDEGETFVPSEVLLDDIRVLFADAGDLDGDGVAEIVFSNRMFTGVLVQGEAGAYQLTDRIGGLNDVRWRNPSGTSIVDIDNDGRLDVSDHSAWYRLEETDGKELAFVEQRPQSNGFRYSQLVDVNGDDVFEAFDSLSVLASLQELPDQPNDNDFASTIHIGLPIYQAIWIDVDGNGIHEIAAHDGRSLWLFEPILDGWLPTKVLETRITSIMAADFDQDGVDELFFQGSSLGRLRLTDAGWIGHLIAGDSTTSDIGAADLDLDGDQDFLTFNRGLYYQENVDGKLFRHDSPRSERLIDYRGTWFGTADFDRDQQVDGLSSRIGRVYLHNALLDSQSTQTLRSDPTNSRVHNAPAIADINGDGWIDIVLAVDEEIQWLPNSPEGFAESWITIVATGIVEPTGLKVLDLDSDGDHDFIVEAIANSVVFVNEGREYAVAEFPGNRIEFSEVGRRALSIGPEGELQVSTFDGNGAFTTSILRQPTSETESYDFNEDGKLTRLDLDVIHAAIVSGDRDPRFDINADGRVSRVDGMQYVERILELPIGDANVDGVFDSSDFVEVFQNDKYEKDMEATWADGDWNFDGRFDTSDFVLAFQRGRYLD